MGEKLIYIEKNTKHYLVAYTVVSEKAKYGETFYKWIWCSPSRIQVRSKENDDKKTDSDSTANRQSFYLDITKLAPTWTLYIGAIMFSLYVYGLILWYSHWSVITLNSLS